ncbi:MAG: thermonuclease family protein [Romboutsia sp.]|nr:thermonuclease family protein [Romboutsia sp.]
MGILNFKKLKSILLSLVLSISMVLTGCSDSSESNNTVNNSSINNNVESSNLEVNNNTDSSELKNQNNSTSNDESSSNKQDESSYTTETTNTSTLSNEILNNSVKATIQRVVDGDTVKLKLNDSGKEVSTRLLLIDTPESVKPGVDPQPFSIEASNYAKKVLKANDTVYLEYDEGDKTDKYDRHLGYLWYFDSDSNTWTMYNEEIVKNGYARVGYIYSQTKYLDRLYKAQDFAKANKLNIWSVDGYVTDNGFNDNSSSSSSSSNSVNSSNQNTSNSASTTNSSSKVYANGGSSTSNKYHSSSTAHNMKGAIEMTEEKAESSGYVPCKVCFN